MFKVYMGVCFGCLGYRVHMSDVRHVRALVSICAKVLAALAIHKNIMCQRIICIYK